MEAPRRRWTHWWLLAISLLVTGTATFAFYRTVRELDRQRFLHGAGETQEQIRARLELYVSTLIAGQGLYDASREVSPDELRTFVRTIGIADRYPGIQGVGFTRRISPDELEAFEAKMRARGLEGFRVWPETPRDEYHAIVMLEPLDRRNRAAIGYDMFSEPVRREAMARARDAGAPAASGRVTLVQEIDPVKQAGFLIYVPVYAGGDPGTVAGRRAALAGFVYAPFRADDLFVGLAATDTARVRLEVYDGDEVTPEALLHRTQGPAHAPRFERLHRIDVAGRTWTLRFTSSPYLDETSTAWLTPTVAGIGLLASAALFLVSWSQVRQRARAETLAGDLGRAVRVRDDFLSIAGHELKTPLSALLLQLQGLERQTTRGQFTPEEPLRQKLGKALGHVGRLERLIGELLDVSRITAGRLSLEPEPTDLAELAAGVVERMADQAARAGCELRLDAPAPVAGTWDRLRLDQVVTNLVGNAIKYGAGEPIVVRVEAAGDGARVSVRDHGIGLAPGDVERVFGRFERAVSERHYGGLGLGLWISRQIVEAHGGRIGVEPVEGAGTLFVVELPRGGGAAPPAA